MVEEDLQGQWLFTVEEVADIFGMNYRTVLGWIRIGKLEASFIGYRYYIQLWDLFEFLDKHKGVKCPYGNPAFKAQRN